MRYHAVELELGPETMSRIGDDWLRRWQETVDDAQETFTRAVSTTNPVDALTLQMEFGMRNAQRWLAWGDLESMATEPEPADDPAQEAEPTAEAVQPASKPPEAAAEPEAAAPPEEDMPVDPQPVDTPPTEAAAPSPAVEERAPVIAPDSKPEPDELQRIRGIGPAIAGKLYARGITSFAQMAALDDAAIAELDSTLDLKGRIERDDWVGQAASLAAKN